MGYFRLTSESGKRERWTVKVEASVLLERCEERIAHHKARVAFWEKEHEAAEAQIRKEGIQLKHFEVTGGRRTEAHLDPSLAKRIGECEQRRKENQDAVNRFTAYKALFRLARGDLELTADDVLYFNLEGADVGGDGEGEED